MKLSATFVGFALILGSASAAEDIAITLERPRSAELGPALFSLHIPPAYLDQTSVSNRRALEDRKVDYVILRVSYPTLAPQPFGMHGKYDENSVRVVIRPRQASSAGRDDAGGFALKLHLRGKEPMVTDGAPFAPHNTQRYVSSDGKGQAFSYVDANGNTVFASCILRTCTGLRTWRGDYVIEYDFSSSLGRDLALVDKSVVRLAETFRPSKVAARE
jgi:hypothetical protein